MASASCTMPEAREYRSFGTSSVVCRLIGGVLERLERTEHRRDGCKCWDRQIASDVKRDHHERSGTGACVREDHCPAPVPSFDERACDRRDKDPRELVREQDDGELGDRPRLKEHPDTDPEPGEVAPYERHELTRPDDEECPVPVLGRR